MRQLGLALHNYESARMAFPPSRLAPDDQPMPSNITNHPGGESAFQSWTTLILPYVEQGNLANQFDLHQPWFDADSSNNRTIISQTLQLFKCPSSPNSDGTDPYHCVGAAAGDYGSINEVKKRVYTDVLNLPDPGSNARSGLLSKFVKPPIARATDGTSNTLYVAECAGQPEVFIANGRMTMEDFTNYGDDKVVNFDGILCPEDGTGWADPDCGFSINGATASGLDKYGPVMINVSEAYSFHPSGACFAMADGSTHFIDESIDALTFVSLCTRAGGEVVGAY